MKPVPSYITDTERRIIFKGVLAVVNLSPEEYNKELAMAELKNDIYVLEAVRMAYRLGLSRGDD